MQWGRAAAGKVNGSGVMIFSVPVLSSSSALPSNGEGICCGKCLSVSPLCRPGLLFALTTTMPVKYRSWFLMRPLCADCWVGGSSLVGSSRCSRSSTRYLWSLHSSLMTVTGTPSKRLPKRHTLGQPMPGHWTNYRVSWSGRKGPTGGGKTRSGGDTGVGGGGATSTKHVHTQQTGERLMPPGDFGSSYLPPSFTVGIDWWLHHALTISFDKTRDVRSSENTRK